MTYQFIELGSPGASHAGGSGAYTESVGFFLGSLHPSNSKMATSNLRTPRLGSASPAETQNCLPKSLSKNPETDSSLRDVSLSLSLSALLMGRWMDGTWPGSDHVSVLSQWAGWGGARQGLLHSEQVRASTPRKIGTVQSNQNKAFKSVTSRGMWLS